MVLHINSAGSRIYFCSNQLVLSKFIVQLPNYNDRNYLTLFSAKIFNIYPRKGAILEGSDADIIILNPERSFVMGAHTHHSRSNTNVYEGRKGKVSSSSHTLNNSIWYGTLIRLLSVSCSFGVGNGGSDDIKGPSGMGGWCAEYRSWFRKIRQDASFWLHL
jgi:hypothetical protein